MSHTIQYRINSHDNPMPDRPVQVTASEEEVEHLVQEGYLVREGLFQGEMLEELRSAVDTLIAEYGGEAGAQENTSQQFGGLFIRNLMDKHAFFHKLIHFDPFVSVARAVLGPQIQIHGTVIRVTYPGQLHQETHWHWHQRNMPSPIPPFFSRPRVLDNLVYLDDLDEDTGGLCVMPKSHLWLHKELPANDFSDKPGQVTLHVPAGTCVTSEACLWHRGLPTLPTGRVRRLLIWGYSPTWMKPVDIPGGGLAEPLIKSSDLLTRELLGKSGWY